MIRFDGVAYLRSQIIYAIATEGSWVENLDHKNGDSLDDRFENLRAATRLQNAQNRKIGRPGRSLPMGVRALAGRFQARIRVEKRMLHLGCYDTPAEAEIVNLAARAEHFGEWA